MSITRVHGSLGNTLQTSHSATTVAERKANAASVALAPLSNDVAANVAAQTGRAGAPARAPVHSFGAESKTFKKAVETALAHLSKQGHGAAQFKPLSVIKDELGMTHVRLQRMHNGAPVFGEHVIIHIDRGGAAESARQTGDVRSLTPASERGFGAAVITPQQATEIAIKEFGVNGEASVERGFFEIFPYRGQFLQGYRIKVRNYDRADGGPTSMIYMIDAATGRVADRWQDSDSFIWKQRPIEIKEAGAAGVAKESEPEGPPAGTANDRTLYSGTVDLSTSQVNGQYILIDNSRGKGVETRDAQNASSGTSAKPFTDNNDAWGENGDPASQKAGVDAHYGATMTYDTLRDVLGYNSIDLKGFKLISNVHINRNYVNAFWDGRTMNYGDGDGRTAGPLTTLDIAGHEIFHGLTGNTAGLIYRNESGGLNEAFSDIGGFLVEWCAAQKNNKVKWDWSMGEDCWTPTNGDPNDALRYLNNPTKDDYSVDHYSNYPQQTEVHGSSGIANNAFYQLAEPNNAGKIPNSTSGVVVKDGIGIDKAAKIFFRGLVHYMRPNTTFSQARVATIQAATDLYGANSTEVQKVKEAWSAVGVEDKNTIPPEQLGPVAARVKAPVERAG